MTEVANALRAELDATNAERDELVHRFAGSEATITPEARTRAARNASRLALMTVGEQRALLTPRPLDSRHRTAHVLHASRQRQGRWWQSTGPLRHMRRAPLCPRPGRDDHVRRTRCARAVIVCFVRRTGCCWGRDAVHRLARWNPRRRAFAGATTVSVHGRRLGRRVAS